MTPAPLPPTLAYLVSAYPAISHTFILREVAQLRALGHRIVTASINRPDRAPGQMEAHERAEAQATYGVKQHGVAGALAALLFWTLRAPLAMLATLRFGLRLRSGGKAWWSGLAYAVEAAWWRAGCAASARATCTCTSAMPAQASACWSNA